MEEGFIEDVYKLFIKNTSMNPLLLYDFTVVEVFLMMEEFGIKYKSDLEMEAYVMSTAINRAITGKVKPLFKEPMKNKKGSKIDREETLLELDDL